MIQMDFHYYFCAFQEYFFLTFWMSVSIKYLGLIPINQYTYDKIYSLSKIEQYFYLSYAEELVKIAHLTIRILARIN